jgi:lysosomal acid lipase/cholesteryl ester hydrolase
MDVWLGNSRSNPPRASLDPAKQGLRYWDYNLNHLGIYDVAAQVG